MDYRYKNLAFRLIGKLPCSDQLHYAMQKYITHSIQHPDSERLLAYRTKVQCHLDAFRDYACVPLQESAYYEFGSGWDLFAALGFSAAGMRELHCIDIRPHIHAEDIRSAVGFYSRNAEQLSLLHTPDALPDIKGYDALCKALQQKYRIRYHAPCSADNTDLPAGSIQCMVSNCTLEHIPAADIPPILRECRRLLSPEGIMSVTIDYQDHWSYADPSVSVYHFLSFDESEWRRLNPSLHFQNRLRHSDYLRILADEGWDILHAATLPVREEDRKALSQLRLAQPFTVYETEDLLIRGAHFVLKTTK